MNEQPSQLLSVNDVRGQVEISIEIVCRCCRRPTTLVFTPTDSVDYCGQCDEPYEYQFSYARLFGGPEII